VLGKRSIVDLPTALIALVTLVLLVKLKKLPEPVIVAAAAIAGLVVYPLLRT
jgi:chromate transporter